MMTDATVRDTRKEPADCSQGGVSTEPRYSQSLARGLAVLGCFTGRRPVRGISDLADELGMGRSTTHRYVITLVALGYLEHAARRKYRLGARCTDIGMRALDATGLREHSHPLLDELRRRTGYTANLAILDGIDILYVDRAHSFRREQHTIDLGLCPGSRLPAYCTAMGKVLLAYLTESERNELLAKLPLTKHGPKTITSSRTLSDELERVYRAGLAVNDEELAPELRAVAVPVRDGTGAVIATTNVAAHVSRVSLDDFVETCRPHLVSVAERISARLGYRHEGDR